MITIDTVARRERLSRLGILEEPMGYVDGQNLYEFVQSSPSSFVDPLGLDSAIIIVRPTPTPQQNQTPGGVLQDATGNHVAIRVGSLVFDFGEYSEDTCKWPGKKNWRLMNLNEFRDKYGADRTLYEYPINMPDEVVQAAVRKIADEQKDADYHVSRCNCTHQIGRIIDTLRPGAGRSISDSSLPKPNDAVGKGPVAGRPSRNYVGAGSGGGGSSSSGSSSSSSSSGSSANSSSSSGSSSGSSGSK